MNLQAWQDGFVNTLMGIEDAEFAKIESAQTRRFQVYRDNCGQAWHKTLSGAYGLIRKLVGEACFEMMATRYQTAYPAKMANLNDYGRDFPEFLSREVLSQEAFSDLAYLPDLAQAEGLLQKSYYALSDTAISASRLGALAELTGDQQSKLCFHLRAHVFVMRSRYPLDLLWQHLRQTKASGTESLHLDEGDYYLCVHRKAYQSELESIDKIDFELVSALQRGVDMDTLLSEIPEASERLPVMFSRQWIRDYTHA
jgi:hypothetical protein